MLLFEVRMVEFEGRFCGVDEGVDEAVIKKKSAFARAQRELNLVAILEQKDRKSVV